ncbi:MAG: hypothetical protein ACP5JE_05300, partial [Thermoplasmata archaeon]
MDCKKVYTGGYYNGEPVDYAVVTSIPYNGLTKLYSLDSYWANRFEYNTSYGIYEDIQGIIIYKLHYTGKPVYYVPYNAYFDHNSFAFGSNFWYGPYTGLAPGIYNITYQLKSSNTSKSNAIVLEVTANGGSTILSSEQINNSVFIEPNRWTNISMTLNISNFYSAVEFKGWLAKGNWTVSLKGVSVAQISPPIRGQKFYDLLKLVNLIPQNSTVLAENNLPAPIPQILTLNSYNLIMPDQINTTKPQYAIANSPRWWFTEFYGSGKYGILAEVYGVVLLEKSYNGSPVYYVPYNAYFDHNSFAFG